MHPPAPSITQDLYTFIVIIWGLALMRFLSLTPIISRFGIFCKEFIREFGIFCKERCFFLHFDIKISIIIGGGGNDEVDEEYKEEEEEEKKKKKKKRKKKGKERKDDPYYL